MTIASTIAYVIAGMFLLFGAFFLGAFAISLVRYNGRDPSMWSFLTAGIVSLVIAWVTSAIAGI